MFQKVKQTINVAPFYPLNGVDKCTGLIDFFVCLKQALLFDQNFVLSHESNRLM